MINVSFLLRDPKAKTSKLYLVCRWNNQLVRWSTGLSIISKEWDQKKKEPRITDPNHLLIKSKMLQLQKTVHAIYMEYEEQEKSIISKHIFKEKLAIATGRQKDNSHLKKSLGHFATNYCKGKRPALRQAFTTFQDFLKYDGREDVTFDQVNKALVNRYVAWMKGTANKGRGFKILTINNKISSLTQFMLEAADEGLHTNVWRISNCKINTSKIAKQVPIALDPDELFALANLELTGDLERTRDLFLIGVYSGQRHSDYSRIKPNMIEAGKLVIRQKKTKKKVRIPLDLCDAWGLPMTFENLLKKYNYTSPHIGYTSFLMWLEKVAKMAGITTPIEVIEEKNGERIPEQFKPKCEALGSHSSRRTFATLLYDAGLSLDAIRRYTGHKSTEMLMRYIGKTEEEYELAAYREAKQKIRSLINTDSPLKKAI